MQIDGFSAAYATNAISTLKETKKNLKKAGLHRAYQSIHVDDAVKSLYSAIWHLKVMATCYLDNSQASITRFKVHLDLLKFTTTRLNTALRLFSESIGKQLKGETQEFLTKLQSTLEKVCLSVQHREIPLEGEYQGQEPCYYQPMDFHRNSKKNRSLKNAIVSLETTNASAEAIKNKIINLFNDLEVNKNCSDTHHEYLLVKIQKNIHKLSPEVDLEKTKPPLSVVSVRDGLTKIPQISFTGTIQNNGNFIYLSIPNLVKDEISKHISRYYGIKDFNPYLGKNPIGSHISIVFAKEYEDKIPNFYHVIGESITIESYCSPKTIVTEKKQKLWIVEIVSKKLEELRESLKLSSRPKNNAYQFHLTIGEKVETYAHKDESSLKPTQGKSELDPVTSPVESPDSDRYSDLNNLHTEMFGGNSSQKVIPFTILLNNKGFEF